MRTFVLQERSFEEYNRLRVRIGLKTHESSEADGRQKHFQLLNRVEFPNLAEMYQYAISGPVRLRNITTHDHINHKNRRYSYDNSDSLIGMEGLVSHVSID